MEGFPGSSPPGAFVPGQPHFYDNGLLPGQSPASSVGRHSDAEQAPDLGSWSAGGANTREPEVRVPEVLADPLGYSSWSGYGMESDYVFPTEGVVGGLPAAYDAGSSGGYAGATGSSHAPGLLQQDWLRADLNYGTGVEMLDSLQATGQSMYADALSRWHNDTHPDVSPCCAPTARTYDLFGTYTESAAAVDNVGPVYVPDQGYSADQQRTPQPAPTHVHVSPSDSKPSYSEVAKNKPKSDMQKGGREDDSKVTKTAGCGPSGGDRLTSQGHPQHNVPRKNPRSAKRPFSHRPHTRPEPSSVKPDSRYGPDTFEGDLLVNAGAKCRKHPSHGSSVSSQSSGAGSTPQSRKGSASSVGSVLSGGLEDLPPRAPQVNVYDMPGPGPGSGVKFNLQTGHVVAERLPAEGVPLRQDKHPQAESVTKPKRADTGREYPQPKEELFFDPKRIFQPQKSKEKVAVSSDKPPVDKSRSRGAVSGASHKDPSSEKFAKIPNRGESDEDTVLNNGKPNTKSANSATFNKSCYINNDLRDMSSNKKETNRETENLASQSKASAASAAASSSSSSPTSVPQFPDPGPAQASKPKPPKQAKEASSHHKAATAQGQQSGSHRSQHAKGTATASKSFEGKPSRPTSSSHRAKDPEPSGGKPKRASHAKRPPYSPSTAQGAAPEAPPRAAPRARPRDDTAGDSHWPDDYTLHTPLSPGERLASGWEWTRRNAVEALKVVWNICFLLLGVILVLLWTLLQLVWVSGSHIVCWCIWRVTGREYTSKPAPEDGSEWWKGTSESPPTRTLQGLKENINLPTTGEEALNRLLACKGKDPYSILGLRTDATDEEIKRYYRRQAVLVHPDKNQNPGAEEAFKILGHAFDLVGEPEKRAGYDSQRVESEEVDDAMHKFADLMTKLQEKMKEAANSVRCDSCGGKHKRVPMARELNSARYCSKCGTMHAVSEGQVWAETRMLGFLWHYYAVMEGQVYDITELAACQRDQFRSIEANAHHVIFRVSTNGNRRPPPSTGRPSEADIEDFLNHLFTQSGPGADAYRAAASADAFTGSSNPFAGRPRGTSPSNPGTWTDPSTSTTSGSNKKSKRRKKRH